MVRPKRRSYSKGASGYGKGSSGYGTYVPTAALARQAPFRPGIDRRNVGNLQVAQGEKKFLDTAITGHVLASTGGTIDDSMLHVAQGTAEQERIGRQITLHNISIKGHFNLAENATESADFCRFIVFLDTQCNGTPAVTADILESASVHSFRNLAKARRFTILQDLHFPINSNNADAASNYGGKFKDHSFYWYSRDGLPIEYNNTTGAIGELESNNVGTLFLNQDGNVAYAGTCRIRYSDK